MYYLQSRYYDPTTCRFINADIYVSTGQGLLGHNMFAYCLNNPVRRIEVWGATSEDIFDEDGNPSTDDDKRFGGGKTGDFGGKGSGKAGGSNGEKTSPTSPSPPAPKESNNNLSSGKVRTPDQQALHDLAKEINQNAKQGKFITYEEAKLIDQWASEYGVDQHHGAFIGSGSHWITGWDHTHIYNTYVPFWVIK